MFVADAHCDTLYNMAIEKMKPEDVCVTPERMAKGNVCLQTFAMFCSFNRPDPFQDGMAMKEAYKKLPVRTYNRRLPDEIPTEIGGILSCEGGEMLRGSIDNLRLFDDDVHMRLIALTWNYDNEIATPAYENAEDGLKPFGFELLREMDARGICADTSHLNERGFWDVIDHARIAPCASHSNCRWLCDKPRNLKKDQVRALIDRKGFIGVNFYSGFLAKDRPALIDDVIANIDAICSMGGEDIVGFGSDFDGIEKWPDGLGNPADFPNLIEALRARGYSQAQLEKIAGLNYWRYLKDAEAAAQI